MANITKRTNKDGSISYLIRVYVDETGSGHQFMKSMTWHPPKKMRPSTAKKEVQRQATLFEDKVRNGEAAFQDGSIRFGDYAREWIRLQPLSPKTRELYTWLLKRIDEAIGHIRLDRLTAHHLELFYKNLGEPGLRQRGSYAVSDKLSGIIKKKKISKTALAQKAGITEPTVKEAVKGNHIRPDTASAICAALGYRMEQLFTVYHSALCLSENTVAHYHRFISAVLMTAKKQRIIPFNVAAEQCTPPKVEHKEAHYLDDKQARRFLAALTEESDIRIKTALMLLLFSGIRRGELLGLSWQDIDFDEQLIHIRRASQVLKGKGVTEVPTKTASSMREIHIASFAMEQLAKYRAWWNELRLKNGDAWRGEKERLFIKDNGLPLYPDTVNFWMNKFLERNGSEHITPHSLRHTFCTLELAAGTDYKTLQSLSGHSQASTLVNIYGHVLESAQRKAAKALENVLLPQSDKKTV